MFSGIIEEMAEVVLIKRDGKTSQLTIKTSNDYDDLKIGDSLSINGVCLTITDCTKNLFSFEFMPETAKISNLGDLKKNDKVNLERSLKFNQRISGHLVSGHVDFSARYFKNLKIKNSSILYFEIPSPFIDYFIPKGSIAINGISLTIIEINKLKNFLTVGIIPHTMKNTNLNFLRYGDKVNIEIDQIAKYVKNQISNRPK
ncbi:MAG: riboflavin synthase [Candidatus Moranbacteria bacterium]|nr:riboflavin synthase [Candidatus Moranbacteria bacterium]